MFAALFATAILAYLMGSFPSGFIVGKLARGVDVRNVGSGKTGATNTLRALGRRYSVLVFILDAAKGALAVILARWLFENLFGLPAQAPNAGAVAALAAVIGHNWSIFIRFDGGRGTSTSFGALLGVWPPMALVALAMFGFVLLTTLRYASLASLAAVGVGALAMIPAVLTGMFPPSYLAWAALAVAIVYFTHRDNIGRLLRGSERQVAVALFPNEALSGRVCVVGATSWGTTLAVVLAGAGRKVTLLTRTQEETAGLQNDRENRRLLPSIPFPKNLSVTDDPAAGLASAQVVILAAPSQTMRANVRRIAAALPRNARLVSAAKGLELAEGKRMSQVIAEEAGASGAIGALSGPNLAREIARGLPAATVVAFDSVGDAEIVRDLLITPRFRVYAHDDLVGVELGGTLKNVIALGAGIVDGLEYGENSKAAYITRGVAEMIRLGASSGANPLTFASLAGLGDLNVTCYSRSSRNRTVGELVGRGQSLEAALAGLGGVAEGVPTTQAARRLAQRLGVEMPITEMIYRVLFEGLDPRRAVDELMSRAPTREMAGLW